MTVVEDDSADVNYEPLQENLFAALARLSPRVRAALSSATAASTVRTRAISVAIPC